MDKEIEARRDPVCGKSRYPGSACVEITCDTQEATINALNRIQTQAQTSHVSTLLIPTTPKSDGSAMTKTAAVLACLKPKMKPRPQWMCGTQKDGNPLPWNGLRRQMTPLIAIAEPTSSG